MLSQRAAGRGQCVWWQRSEGRGVPVCRRQGNITGHLQSDPDSRSKHVWVRLTFLCVNDGKMVTNASFLCLSGHVYYYYENMSINVLHVHILSLGVRGFMWKLFLFGCLMSLLDIRIYQDKNAWAWLPKIYVGSGVLLVIQSVKNIKI